MTSVHEINRHFTRVFLSVATGSLTLAILLLSTGGCSQRIFGTVDHTPERMLTIHKIASSEQMAQTDFVKKVDRKHAGPIYVSSSPALGPNSFKSISLISDSSASGLRITLDSHGKFVWYQTYSELRGTAVALFIDGKFEKLIKKPYLREMSNQLVIPLDWEETKLKELAKGLRQRMSG